jgi:hypothetical protein
MEPKKDFDTATLLNDHGKDITGLSEKLAKCYSSERYEDFQAAVKKNVLEVMGSDEGRDKIKAHAKESTKEYNEEQKENTKH